MISIIQDLAEEVKRDATNARQRAEVLQRNHSDMSKKFLPKAMDIASSPTVTACELQKAMDRLSGYQKQWLGISNQCVRYWTEVAERWKLKPNINQVAQYHNAKEDTCEAIREIYTTNIESTKGVTASANTAFNELQMAFSKGDLPADLSYV